MGGATTPRYSEDKRTESRIYILLNQLIRNLPNIRIGIFQLEVLVAVVDV